jgi:hypothetical protein
MRFPAAVENARRPALLPDSKPALPRLIEFF